MTHPTISQLFALGYQIGDRVTGRNISVHKKNNQDWAGTLTANNIQIQEYSWKSGTVELDGDIHEDGLSWLKRENSQDKNIYFNVNGGRTNKEVKSWKAVFFEEDYGTFEEQQAKIDAIPLKLSLQIQTRKSNHCYFTVQPEETKNPKQWNSLQEIIAYIMGSDPSVKDLPRLMRLSGFDHVKLNQETGTIARVKCITKYINPNNVYSIQEVVEAFNIYAANNGIKPYSEERFKAYQFVIYKLRQTKFYYQHELFNPDFFRTCDDSEIYERLQRCKLWTRLIEKKTDNPDTAWTCSLERAKKRVRDEYEISRIPTTVNENEEPLTVQWSRNLEGFKERGRSEWHTAKCPVHHGFSLDSLHIHITSGKIKCHSGCDESEIITKLSQIARDKGDERWNWSLWRETETTVKGKDKDREFNNDNAQLNTEIFLYKQATSLDFKKLEELGIKVTKINKKLLSASDLNLEKGKITFVISPKGTGKTKASGEALKDYDALNSWHHRISLGRSIQKTLNVTYYDDLHKAKNKNRVSFCAQRSHQLNPTKLRENGALFIDECNQVLDFCFSGLCNTNNNRPLILNALHEQLQAAVFGGVALFMSADIAMKEVMLIHSLALPGTPIEIIINEYQPEQGTVYFSNDKTPDGLVAKLIETLRNNESCFVIDDFKNSYRGGKTLAEIIQTEDPNLRLKIIHAENSGSDESRKFLDNVDEESLEVDVFIVSPSVTSGVSIENGRFKHCFAFINGILTDDQVLQAINRPRGCENFYIWAANKGLGTEAGGAITPQEVHNFYLRNYDTRNLHFRSYGVEYNVIADEWTSPFWKLYCENVALDNLIKRRLNFWIKDRLNKEGYAVVDTEFGENKELVKELKIGWKKISIAEANEISNAKLNSPEEQTKLREKMESGASLNPEELASYRKTHLHETFGEEFINACEKEIVIDKNTLHKVTLKGYAALAIENQGQRLEKGLNRYYKFFHRPIEDCINADKNRDINQRNSGQHYDGFMFPADIRWSTREHLFWDRIGFKEYLQPERRWQGWELSELIGKILPNADHTKDAIGIDFKRPDLQKYHSKGFVELCSRLGLKTEVERSTTGDRTRSYYITSKSLELAEMFVRHQEIKRALREELKSGQTSDIYSNSVSFDGVWPDTQTLTVQGLQPTQTFNISAPSEPQKIAVLDICSHPILGLHESYLLKEELISEVSSKEEFKVWLDRHYLTTETFKLNILPKIEAPQLRMEFEQWIRQ